MGHMKKENLKGKCLEHKTMMLFWQLLKHVWERKKIYKEFNMNIWSLMKLKELKMIKVFFHKYYVNLKHVIEYF